MVCDDRLPISLTRCWQTFVTDFCFTVARTILVDLKSYWSWILTHTDMSTRSDMLLSVLTRTLSFQQIPLIDSTDRQHWQTTLTHTSDIQQGRTALTYIIDTQQLQTAVTYISDAQQWQTAGTDSTDGPIESEWTWTFRRQGGPRSVDDQCMTGLYCIMIAFHQYPSIVWLYVYIIVYIIYTCVPYGVSEVSPHHDKLEL